MYIRSNLLSYSNPFKFHILWHRISKSESPKIVEPVVDVKCGNQSTNIVLNENNTFTLSSPGFPYGYDSYLNCSWIASSNSSIMHPVFHFEILDLEDSDDCLSDYVELFSSSDLITWNSLGRNCKLAVLGLGPYFSGKKYLKLNFITNYYQNRTGFSGKFQSDCGSTLSQSTGTITFNPSIFNRNMGISSNLTCVWSIRVRPGKMVRFTFRKIEIDCALRSTIIIKNGIDEYSPILGGKRYCGNASSIPDVPLTSGSGAIIKFDVKSSMLPDFILDFQEVGQDCSERIVLSQSQKFVTIMSPNFPNVPDPYTECTWIITSESGENLKIEFPGRFDLKSSRNCESEYVEIRTGNTRVAQSIGRYCDQRPNPQIIESSTIQVKYFTSNADPNNGFIMNITIALCGGIYQNTEGIIKSPMYDQSTYPPNLECHYHIIGRPGSFLTITLDELVLPEEENCTVTDHLAIYTYTESIADDGTSNRELELQGTYCGYNSYDVTQHKITVPSDDVLIKFITTSSSYAGDGWKITYNTSREKCGGEYSGETGFVTSTGYPTAKQIPRHCEFKITVPEGRRVTVEFIDLDLYNSVGSRRQRLLFVHGFDRNFFIQLVTGNDTLANLLPISSSSNQMMIILRTQVQSQNRGFKIRFTSNSPTICDGDMTQLEGTITSPQNESSFVCEYSRNGEPFYVDAPNVGTIALDFEEILTNNHNCRFNGVGVKLYSDMNNINNIFCLNSTRYHLLRVPSSRVSVLVKKHGFIRSREFNFKMNYKVHRCGGRVQLDYDKTINLPIDGISATNYGKIDCAWQITAGPNEVIIFNLTRVNLKLPADDEFIRVYQGGSQMHPLIKTYIMNEQNTNLIISQRNQLFIEYYSKNYSTASSFEIKLEASSVACGGILTDHSMHLSSPRINANTSHYPPNTECTWEINALPGYHIGLVFTNRFYLEDSPNCQNDFVEIFDWIDDQWKSMKRVCGRETPNAFNSTSTKMKVVFRSNENITADGFSAVWYENCGGFFNATETVQEISSPNYPDNYKKSQYCVYNITVLPGKYVNLRFIDFELEATMTQCIFDNVTIYKKQEYSTIGAKDFVGTYCGTNSPGSKRLLESTEVIFQTDRTLESRGFKFEYYLDSCGGNVTEPQVIVSKTDESSNAIPHSSDCWWNITAPEGQKITVQFEELNLQYCADCYCHAIEVFDGENALPQKRLAKLCGELSKAPPIIVIPNNKGSVHLKTDASRESKKVRAIIKFSTKCDQIFELSDSQPVVIISNTAALGNLQWDCQYKIKSPLDSIIELKFKKLNLGHCESSLNRTSNCSCDFVEIRDGITPVDSFIGRFCGDSMPTQVITTSRDSLWIHLIADSSKNVREFEAEIRMKPSICGKRYYNTSTSEIILEPPKDNQGKYLPNLNCLWTVEATSTSNLLEIEFEQFDIQDEDDSGICSSDYLEITEIVYYHVVHEGLGENFVHNGRVDSQTSFYMGIRNPSTTTTYCGSKKPNTFLSAQSKANIRFKTNGIVEKSGFKLKVRSHSGKMVLN